MLSALLPTRLHRPCPESKPNMKTHKHTLRGTHLEALSPLERNERVSKNALRLVQVEVHLPRHEIKAVEVRLQPRHRVLARNLSPLRRRRFFRLLAFAETDYVAEELRTVPFRSATTAHGANECARMKLGGAWMAGAVTRRNRDWMKISAT